MSPKENTKEFIRTMLTISARQALDLAARGSYSICPSVHLERLTQMRLLDRTSEGSGYTMNSEVREAWSEIVAEDNAKYEEDCRNLGVKKENP